MVHAGSVLAATQDTLHDKRCCSQHHCTVYVEVLHNGLAFTFLMVPLPSARQASFFMQSLRYDSLAARCRCAAGIFLVFE